MTTFPKPSAGRRQPVPDERRPRSEHPRDRLPVLELDDFGRYREVRPSRTDCYLTVLIAQQRHKWQEPADLSTVDPSVFWG